MAIIVVRVALLLIKYLINFLSILSLSVNPRMGLIKISNSFTKLYKPFVAMATVGTTHGLTIIDRAGWGARPPKSTQPMSTPVPYVIIHNSESPGACTAPNACAAAMKSMQNFHMDGKGWADIGYSFAVGGDGNVYEGRGWTRVGAHAPDYNSKSVGICLIGDWKTELPPEKQLRVVRELIEFGVVRGYVARGYKLMGHRQVRDTDCPGDRLFEEIETWDHFAKRP